MFEGGLRVPCIVRWPGTIPPGAVGNEFLTSMEIFPTLCKAVGATPPKDLILDGYDMADVLRGKKKSPRKEMYWQRRGERAARVGSYKWIESKNASGLFDLEADISEETDLSANHPQIISRIKQHFTNWQRQMAQAEPRGPFRDF